MSRHTCSSVATAIFLFFTLTPGPAAAQTAAPARASTVTHGIVWQVRNTTRAEVWRFFEPAPGGGDPDYAFLANRLLAGLEVKRPRVTFAAQLQYVQFTGLPASAAGPGPLGTGALYFNHAGRSNSRQVFIKGLHATFLPGNGVRIQVGRFGITGGAESPSGNARIETVKRQRLDARLIGEFEWSLYQRAFDGARVDVDRRGWHASAAVVRPTQGGFEEQAGKPMNGLRLTTASLTAKPGTLIPDTDVQAFVYRYSDERSVRSRPDNTFLTAPAVDVHVTAVGASLAGVYPVGAGHLDTVGWWVWQTGDWYGQDHRASAFAGEVGCQWTSLSSRPWLRVGVFRSTGDDNAGDRRHGTFFQMLPTGRKYSFSTAYSLMNITDVLAQLQTRPHTNLGVRLDVHKLRLTRAADLWYGGSGATQRTGSIFGFAGRPANGSTDLGWVIEGSAAWTVSRQLGINAYLGRMAGGEVVGRLFKGRRLVFGYAESVITF